MSKEKKKVFGSALVYLISFFVIDLFFLFFLQLVGNDWNGIVIALGMTFFPALFLAFTIARFILSDLFHMQRSLSRFVMDTLHELNIPLSTIMGNAQLLRQTPLSSMQERRVDRIADAAKHLLTLHQDLDDYIRIETDTLPKRLIDLHTLIEERLHTLESTLSGHRLVKHISPFSVMVEPIALRRTLDNLIINAAKFSPTQSTITITLQGGRFSIKDQGRGIAPESMVYIFERYYREDPASPGEGIGLHQVKRFCDTHGLAIEIQSHVGKGTEIRIDFSLCFADNRGELP